MPNVDMQSYVYGFKPRYIETMRDDHITFASSITLCRAENLAEPWCLSAPSSRASPAQRRALSGATRARVPPLPPSPHDEKLSDVGYGKQWERLREIWIKSGGRYSVSPAVSGAGSLGLQGLPAGRYGWRLSLPHPDHEWSSKHLLKRCQVLLDTPDCDLALMCGVDLQCHVARIDHTQACALDVASLAAVQRLGQAE